MVEIKKVSDMEFGYAKILIFGEAGSGKTYFASTYDHKKTLFVNVKSESGMLTLRALGSDLDVIEIDNYADMKEAVNWIKTNGSKYDVLYIDSLSQWQRNLEKEIPETGNRFAKWDTIKEYTKEAINSFKALPFHVVFTCEIKKDKDESTGEIVYNPALQGSSREEIPYWFDEVYYFKRFQAKTSDPISYKALTSAAMKYPCKSRLGMPVNIDNPNLTEITAMACFKKIDKAVQTKELFEIAEKKELLSDTNLESLRELLATKDVDIVKFLKYFDAKDIPSFPDDKIATALNMLKDVKDKPKKETK